MGKQWRRVKQYSEGMVFKATHDIFIDHPDGSYDTFLEGDYIVADSQPNELYSVRVEGKELEDLLECKAYNVDDKMQTYFCKL